MMQFTDRKEAGRRLAAQLDQYRDRKDVVVLGLPRGGVPVAAEVAAALRAPLDVFLVRKLGVPGQEELAMGAIAPGGVRVLNDEVVGALSIPADSIEAVTRAEQRELDRRMREYRGARPALEMRGRIGILIDDGLATGSTMRAAAAALRRMQPAKIVVAVPVAAESTCEDFRLNPDVDELVCLATPEPFRAVGLWYDDFSQTTDEQVRQALGAAERRARGAPPDWRQEVQ